MLERGVLLPLRFELDHHVNLRPVKLFAGVATPLAGKGPADIDMVVCREGTEGPYVGSGGTLRRGTPHEVATEESLNTRFGVERIVRDAFSRAGARRGKVTLVHKTNVLVHAGSLWQRTFDQVAAEYPDITTDYCHVDAAAMFFLTQPERFDVVVTDNLFGDILTDIGAAIAGGIGLAASGNIDPSRTNPSMFEPVHGSAPDIAGQGKADPTATVLSVAMLLAHLGHQEAADRVEACGGRGPGGAGDRRSLDQRDRRRPGGRRRGLRRTSRPPTPCSGRLRSGDSDPRVVPGRACRSPDGVAVRDAKQGSMFPSRAGGVILR